MGLLFLLSSAPSLFPGTPLADLFDGHLVHGLVERVLILSLFGLLLVVGVGVRRVAVSPSSASVAAFNPPRRPVAAQLQGVSA